MLSCRGNKPAFEQISLSFSWPSVHLRFDIICYFIYVKLHWILQVRLQKIQERYQTAVPCTSQLENKIRRISKVYFSQWTEKGMFTALQFTSSSLITHLCAFSLYSLILQKPNSVPREPVEGAELNVHPDISVMSSARTGKRSQSKLDYQSTTGVFLWDVCLSTPMWLSPPQGCGPLITSANTTWFVPGLTFGDRHPFLP